MSASTRTPSLTPSRSPSPAPHVQPDHFYRAEDNHHMPSPKSSTRMRLDPEDDLLAQRGIPVFKPTMDEFRDFEDYVSKIECWGSKSGIVKVIPPKEWVDALPPLNGQLAQVKIKTPIEQHMLGSRGLFRQENMEKRRIMSVREWAELCSKDDFKAPGVKDVGLHARSNVEVRKLRRGRRRDGTRDVEAAAAAHIGNETVDDTMEVDRNIQEGYGEHAGSSTANDQSSSAILDETTSTPPPITAASNLESQIGSASASTDGKPVAKTKRAAQTREGREASLAERAARDSEFLKAFNPHNDWLPPNTSASDYTPEFCQKLERQYWRNCGLGRPAWYGADTAGSLYTDTTTSWNVAHLPSALSRLLPASSKGLPGVNTPYLYFGMWRATFSWHVEDMDLFSINYIHFGAPKFWYAVPQGRAAALESTMKSYFPRDTSQCPQFLRHKSFLASPTLLAQASCRPNVLVQQAGEFVITFPRGYHAGFNLGFNCAESVNFALESWLDMGRKAQICQCTSDSVRIDVDQLLREKDEAGLKSSPEDSNSKSPRKRKAEGTAAPRPKKAKVETPSSSKAGAGPSAIKLSVMLKLGPRPADPEPLPCILCVSGEKEGLLRVHDPPIGRALFDSNGQALMAHEQCANVIPETWVDDIQVEQNGERRSEKVVFGVDGIVKDRWNLKCSACSNSRHKGHGAPIQCTKGKCPKAFHVTCAKYGAANNILFEVTREVEKEVVLLTPHAQPRPPALGVPNLEGMPTHGAEMPVDLEPLPDDEPHVLKIIKKVEVMCLCPQHNPAVAAAKKTAKQNKIKQDLLALPPMTRIKIRVSAGVFEVSLIRVIEETGSIEVLWDRGVKREFKWGSVVFGSTEGQTIQQKPSEYVQQSLNACTSATAAPTRIPLPSNAYGHLTATVRYPLYSHRPAGYTSGPPWTYSYQQQHQSHSPSLPGTSEPNPYTAYYGGSRQFNPTPYGAPYYGMPASQYRWQQPYTGPQVGVSRTDARPRAFVDEQGNINTFEAVESHRPLDAGSLDSADAHPLPDAVIASQQKAGSSENVAEIPPAIDIGSE